MKIILTGNASADHFYPIIAVAEELNKIIDDENIAETKLFYFSNKPYDKKSLYENGVIFRKTSAGKSRLSPASFFGKIQAFFAVFAVFPDVVFSTGGYMAYPTVWAARILRIPIIIHESNSVPGPINLWSGSFAKAITSAYKQVVDYFDRKKIFHLGQPMRHSLKVPTKEGSFSYLDLDPDVPVIWFLMGSNNAKNINRVLEEALPTLLERYQVVHQTGKDDYEEMKMLTDATLINNEYKHRYHSFDFLNELSLKMLAGVSSLVVSRAGSSLFEIAHWEIPSIIIPITHSYKNHQLKNAYAYAREGGCIVIEENNLSDKGLIFEINRLVAEKKTRKRMIEGAQRFAIKDAGRNIAEEIVAIGLEHERV